MAEFYIRFLCELLEDAHCGSGEGHLDLVDDLHAKDRMGRPVCWSTTFLGLLRDQAEELVGHGHCDHGTIAKLFGTEGSDTPRRVLATSLHFSPPGEISAAGSEPGLTSPDRLFLLRTQTSREAETRRPLDQTLRTRELARAGLTAAGEIRLQGSESDSDFLQLCLRRLRSIGSDKSKSLGRIRISQLETRTPTTAPPLPLAGSGVLRIVLRNLEPVCFPQTGYPGNIIQTRHTMPGSAVRGAFLTELQRMGVSAADRSVLADPAHTQFGPGYPFPWDETKGVPDRVLPLPLSAREVKESHRSSQAPGAAPWWLSDGESSDWYYAPSGVRTDALLLENETKSDTDPEKETGQVPLKRVKQVRFLSCFGDEPWRQCTPLVSHRMRNRVPVRRQGRTMDSRRLQLEDSDRESDHGHLFTESALAEDQAFVVGIRLDAKAAETLANLPGDLWNQPDPARRRWLRMGRGGRPVRIERADWISSDTEHVQQDLHPRQETESTWYGFTITLQTDLIARAVDLTFLTSLNAADWARLAGMPEPPTGLRVGKAALETRVVHGFNSAAGTRRLPAMAIRAGSAFLVEGTEPDQVKALRTALLETLKAAGNLGERGEEGFGRAWIDLSFHRQAVHDSKPDVPSNPDAKDGEETNLRERLYRGVLESDAVLSQSLNLEKADGSGPLGPSRTQWQTLRHQLEREAAPPALEVLASLQRSVREPWAVPVDGTPLLSWLERRCGDPNVRHAQGPFLAELARCMSTRLKDLEHEEILSQ